MNAAPVTTARAESPDAPTRAQRGFRIVFAWTAAIHGLLVIAQPFTAGISLDFGAPALNWHGTTANTIVSLGAIQVILAILAWRPGRMPWTVPVLATTLFAGELWQLAAGYGAEFTVHIPLGVGLVAGSVILAVLAVRGARNRR